MSTFSWLDHSDKERRRVLDAIERFRETETRDELGIGSIRDGFADRLFPGTNVLMTRARYFLFVPWLYMDVEERRGRGEFAARLRTAEVHLISGLGDEVGTIGRLAKGTLKRMPSSIYWLGLEGWGIRAFRGTQSEYHEAIDAGLPLTTEEWDEENLITDDRGTWHAAIPAAPDGFPKAAGMALTPDEASYLGERIQMTAPSSMLVLLLRPGWLPDVDYPWLHPHVADFPDDVRFVLGHAQHFAEVMQGAAILYNLMLAEAGRRDTVDYFKGRLEDWSNELTVRGAAITSWDKASFWQLATSLANVRASTRAFVDRWVDLQTWRSPLLACEDPQARALIRQREEQLKGRARARLVDARALERWGGESGTGRLSYRWPTAKRLVGDIVEAGHA